MFRFLKGFMKGDKPPPALGIADIPAWIGSEEKRMRDDLTRRVVDPRAVVLEARKGMEAVLSGFETDSVEEVPHRKLAGVTERSLPLFLKAMRISISRDLPDDPEGFYTAAGEILKGCLSAFRGQGRYLASRFPEEMKMLRDGVDTIGREVNSLTPGISRARERLRGLSELRESLESYTDTKRRITLGREEMRSLEDEAGRSRQSLEAVNRAIAELEKGEEYLACQEEIARIRGLEEDRTETTRLYRATAATAVHLLRKGEKIASRNKDRDAARVLHETVELLDREIPIPEDTASRIIPLGQGAIAAMVASGDLTPKNREEIDLIEGPERLVRRITEVSRRFREISGGIASAQDALLSRPALAKSRDLKKEAEDLEKRMARAKDRLEQVRGEGADLESRMHASLDDVQRRVEALSGRPVQIREPDLA